MHPKPMVSICITTYNHEKYLAEALDSVLSQKVNFEFEVIIGEDYSTDSTLQIAQDYQARYPNLIKVVQSGHSEKLVINGHKTGRYNFLNALSLCQGKYIALLDGDDYWIDPYKLQKQVDFLEQHEEYSFIFHNVYRDNLKSGATGEARPTFHSNNFLGEAGLDEKFMVHNIAPTSSVVLRNNIPKEFPDIFYKASIGDWPFHIYNLNFGQAKYIKDVMAVYRIGDGMWSQKSLIDQLLPVIQTYKYLPSVVPPKLVGEMRRAIAIHYRRLIRLYLREAKLKLRHAVKAGVDLCKYLLTGKIT
jgi:glycosyltransferase involved in cell wall biosynthesis